MIRKIIGWAILITLFLLLFIGLPLFLGGIYALKCALLGVGISAIVAGLVYLAMWLIMF